MDVVYAADLPPEVRSAIAPHLARWRWMLPGWCAQMFVYFSKDGRGLLSTTTNVPYRYTSFFVHGAWLEEPEAMRAQHVAHEFAHVLTAPLVTEARRILEAHVPEGPQREWAGQAITDAMEGVVCDIEHAVRRLPPLPVAEAMRDP
jgi:hypothetical protein